MAEACRRDISDWRRGSGANAGLLRDRFLQVQEKENNEKKDEFHKARKELFAEMQKSLQNSTEVYRLTFSRQKNLIHSPKEEGEFETVGRLIIGLGGENVLETGITLHHTYGTPIIPGTALKGLASNYCDRIWGRGAEKPGFKRDEIYHKAIFGSTADSVDKDSGHIIFHDAWITPNSVVDSLKTDVMTPHHGDYYSGTILPSGEPTAPTDFDSPNPVTFLSIVGTFHIVVSCDVVGEMCEAENKVEGQKWAELAFDLLTDALKDWGIGGKTNSGYGRLRITANEGCIEEHVSEVTQMATDRASEIVSSPTIEASSKIGAQMMTGEESRSKAPVSVVESDVMKPNYSKGVKIEAVREVDPKGYNRLYFRADDGFGGFLRAVKGGKLPSWEIGRKVLLEVAGISGDVYDFVVPGSMEESIRKMKERRRK